MTLTSAPRPISPSELKALISAVVVDADTLVWNLGFYLTGGVGAAP
jgi:hypothetical protein